MQETNALTKEKLIEKVIKALQVCSIANTVINEQNDIIMKYTKNMLEKSTSPLDDALAPAPDSAPAPVSAPASTSAPAPMNASKTFASVVKNTQPIIVKPSDSDVNVTSKEMLSKANEALKKVNVRNARVTDKGTLVVEVSSEKDRESAVTKLKEGFSESYVVEGAKMLLPKVTVVGIPSDMSEDEIISAICEKDEQLNQFVVSGKTLEVVPHNSTYFDSSWWN